MLVGLTIFFSIIAVILLIGMIGDKDADSRKNFTVAFCMSLIAIIAIALKL